MFSLVNLVVRGLDYQDVLQVRTELKLCIPIVDFHILGVDFLAKKNWLVDIPSKQILDSTTHTLIFSVRKGTIVAEGPR